MTPNGINSPNVEDDKVFISRAGWYTLRYPTAWELEEHNDSVTLLEPLRGVGALVFSSYRIPEENDAPGSLMQFFTSQNIALAKEVAIANQGDTTIASCDHITGEKYVKAWAIVRQRTLVLVTYNCKAGLQEMERAFVERIVKSVRVLGREMFLDPKPQTLEIP